MLAETLGAGGERLLFGQRTAVRVVRRGRTGGRAGRSDHLRAAAQLAGQTVGGAHHARTLFGLKRHIVSTVHVVR